MQENVKIDKYITLTIRKIGINGEGIGYYKKLAVFVDNAIVDEIVKVKITEVYRGYARGIVERVNKKSKNRVKPFCEFYNDCGGCNVMHMNYDTQLEVKLQILDEALKRYTKLNYPVKLEGIKGMKDPYFYRNKAQLPLWYQSGRTKVGMYEVNSNRLVFIDHCKIQHKFVNRVIEKILPIIDRYKIKVFDKTSKQGCLKNIIVRIGNLNKELQVTFVYANYDKALKDLCDDVIMLDNVKSVYINENNTQSHEIVTDEYKLMNGSAKIKERIMDLEFNLLPKSFMQLNLIQTEQLYKEVIRNCGIVKTDVVLDAYCGVGTIGLLLAKNCKEVIGIELNKQACLDATENMELNNIKNISFKQGKVEEIYPTLRKEKNIDAIIVDPPRTGLDASFKRMLLNNVVNKFIYISCNPSTLAKDLEVLKAKYKIIKIKCFDMFPQTSHVESVVLLHRKK